MSRPLIFPVAIIGLIAAAALTGCSAGGLPGSSSSDPGSGGSSGSSSAPTTGGASGTSFTLPKTCVSAADVASILGIPAYGPTTSADSTSLTCEYLTASQDGPIIDIEPNKGLTASNLAAKMQAGGTLKNLSSVSGVGDAAVVFTVKNGHGIYALAGKYTIDIAGLSASDTGLENLAKKVISG
jgi:hypothetical protein